MSVAVTTLSSSTRAVPTTSVQISFGTLPRVGGREQRINFVGDEYLQDERGRRFSTRPSLQSLTTSNGEYRYFFDESKLPRARRLTFHQRFSFGESWPVDVSAVLRDGAN